MLIEKKFVFSPNNIAHSNSGYTLFENADGHTSRIISLRSNELLVSQRLLKKLGIHSATLFYAKGISDCILGADFRTPIFCKTIRQDDKVALSQSSIKTISDCLDNMKTLHLMFFDSKAAADILEKNIKTLSKILDTTKTYGRW